MINSDECDSRKVILRSIEAYSSISHPDSGGALPGDTMVRVTNVSRFLPGILVGIGQDGTFEVKYIKGIAGDFLVFDEPLEHVHDVGESVEILVVDCRVSAAPTSASRGVIW